MAGSVEILDYTNSQIVTIDYGQAKTQTGNFKIIHDVDLKQYDRLLLEIEGTLRQDITVENPLHPYLEHELQQTRELLDNLKPRVGKRSLNFLGSAWKWVAGSPDHEDYVTIQDKINNLLKNNNQQVIINKSLNEQLNKLTNVANKIEKFVKTSQDYKQEFVSSTQYKLKLIKEELVNIRYAVNFAKSGTINTMMLTPKEIEVALNVLDKEKLPYSTPEEALAFSKVKVISNDLTLLYIVNVPITSEETFAKILVKPVKKGNAIIEIFSKFILKNEKKIYSIVKECNNINRLSICNQMNLIDISNTSCIPRLLLSSDSSCNKISGQQVPTLEEITSGILLVNDYEGPVNINETSRELNGTFIIKFENATINLNGQSFSSNDASYLQPLPAIFQPTPREKQYKEILSLESIKELHINNFHEIELMKTENKIVKLTNCGFAMVIIIIVIVFLINKFLGGNRSTISITQNTETDKMRHQHPATISIPPPSSTPKIYSSPFF